MIVYRVVIGIVYYAVLSLPASLEDSPVGDRTPPEGHER